MLGILELDTPAHLSCNTPLMWFNVQTHNIMCCCVAELPALVPILPLQQNRVKYSRND